jgi:hypothetical protein
MTQEDIDLFLESVDIGYTRCNVQPISGIYFKYCNNALAGCGIASALINKNGIDLAVWKKEGSATRFKSIAQRDFNLSELFLGGFIYGFDGHISGSAPDDPSDYSRGYRYGLEKRKKWIMKSEKETQ